MLQRPFKQATNSRDGTVKKSIPLFAACAFTCGSTLANTSAHNGFLNVLLRYENDTEHLQLRDRERIRSIIRAGVISTWSDTWQTQVRLSSGLKNQQNVPAITLHRFNDQRIPDRDVYIDRAFATGKFNDITLKLGKMPWGSKQVTDIFWDRDLNPIGASVDWKVNKAHSLHVSHLKPLDGSSDTTGTLNIVQWQYQFKMDDWSFGIMPWWAKFDSDPQAQYATRDTQFDNQFVRVSAFAKYGQWQLGADVGKSIESDSEIFATGDVSNEFKGEDTSIAVELRHGSLKHEGDTLTQFKAFHVERFGVIREFAQNAVARYTTANVKGWDARVRHRISKNIWLGVRYSDTETLKGDAEQGKRFRIETQLSF